MTKYLREQGNISNFKTQKAENKFGSSFGNKGTQANFLREVGPLLEGPVKPGGKVNPLRPLHDLAWG